MIQNHNNKVDTTLVNISGNKKGSSHEMTKEQSESWFGSSENKENG
jgi:hypothetical protein